MNVLEKYAKKRSLSEKLKMVSGGLAGGWSGAVLGGAGAGLTAIHSKAPYKAEFLDGPMPKSRRILPKSFKRLLDKPKALAAIGAGTVIASAAGGAYGGAKAGKYMSRKPKDSYGGKAGRVTAQTIGGAAGLLPGLYAGSMTGLIGGGLASGVPGKAGKALSSLALLGGLALGTAGGVTVGAAAGRKLTEKKASAWSKIANMAAVKPPNAPGKAAKGAGIPAPKNPAGKTSNIKPIKVSMNTRGAMPQ